jgi:DNA polymerase-1
MIMPAPVAPKVFHGVAGGKYTLINTMPAWKELLEELMTRQYLCWDTETEGFDWTVKRIVGFSISWGAANSYYIPIRHDTDEKQLKIEDILDDLKAVLGRKDLVTIWHNAKFDLHFLKREGIEVRGVVHDTLILHKLIKEYGSADLKDLAVAEIHPDANMWEKAVNDYRVKRGRVKVPAPLPGKPNRKIALKKENVHYGMVLIEIMAPYAASDAHYCWILFKKKLPEILADPDLRKLYLMESRLLWVLFEMEENGAFIDKDHLEKIKPELEKEIEERGRKIVEELGDINIDSKDQLIKAFQEKDVKFTKKTKKAKKIALDKDVLERLAVRYKICDDVVKRKQIQKLHKTYAVGILTKLDIDNYIHCQMNQNVTTGRMSISNPNLQNIPNPKDELSSLIRQAFIAPPGYVMVLIDYSQIEVRLLAHYSKDPLLMKVYCETFEDVHLRTACEMFGWDYEEALMIKADEDHPKHHELNLNRKVAKTINFLIIYGGGAALLAQKISTPEKRFKVHECKAYMATYKERLRGVTRWINREKLFIRRNLEGQNYFGRYRRLPELRGAASRTYSDDNWGDARAERQWVNFLIQGSAADLFKMAMVRVNDLLHKEKAESRLVVPVHDEIIFYMKRDELALLKPIRQVMQDWNFNVPIVADISFATSNWAEKKELKLAA